MCMSVCVVADYLKVNCKDLYDEIYNRGYKDSFNVDRTEERNKAIDDFTEKATKIVYEANDRDRNPQPRDMVADIHYKLIELAEQLKAGGSIG